MSKLQYESAEELLVEWFRRVRESQHAHYHSANYFAKFNYIFGVPSIVFSTFVGTSVFATLDQSVSPSAKITVGIISVLAAILSALQVFLRFSERAEKHRSAGARYGAIRRDIEMLKITLVNGELKENEDDLKKIKDQIDILAGEAPEIPKRVYEMVQKARKE